jgi:hypothetical protein
MTRAYSVFTTFVLIQCNFEHVWLWTSPWRSIEIGPCLLRSSTVPTWIGFLTFSCLNCRWRLRVYLWCKRSATLAKRFGAHPTNTFRPRSVHIGPRMQRELLTRRKTRTDVELDCHRVLRSTSFKLLRISSSWHACDQSWDYLLHCGRGSSTFILWSNNTLSYNRWGQYQNVCSFDIICNAEIVKWVRNT